MIDLEIMVSEYLKDGYSELFAEARVCQDIVLKAIAKSPMNQDKNGSWSSQEYPDRAG